VYHVSLSEKHFGVFEKRPADCQMLSEASCAATSDRFAKGGANRQPRTFPTAITSIAADHWDRNRACSALGGRFPFPARVVGLPRKTCVGSPRLSRESQLLAGCIFETADINSFPGLQVCSPYGSFLPRPEVGWPGFRLTSATSTLAGHTGIIGCSGIAGVSGARLERHLGGGA